MKIEELHSESRKEDPPIEPLSEQAVMASVWQEIHEKQKLGTNRVGSSDDGIISGVLERLDTEDVRAVLRETIFAIQEAQNDEEVSNFEKMFQFLIVKILAHIPEPYSDHTKKENRGVFHNLEQNLFLLFS